MSVIVYDGQTMASDRQGCCGDTIRTAKKLFRQSNGDIVGFTGGLGAGMVMVKWHEDGADPDKWPKCNEDDGWVHFVVASKNGVYFYEKYPCPIPVVDPFSAWGNGREVALGALAMGADAVTAVEITSRFITGVGNGCDHFDIPVNTGG